MKIKKTLVSAPSVPATRPGEWYPSSSTSKIFLPSGLIKMCADTVVMALLCFTGSPLYVRQIFELRQNIVIHNGKQKGMGV